MTDENESTPQGKPKAVSIATDPVKSMNCGRCDTKIDVSGIEAFTGIECPQCGHHEQVPAQLGQFRLLRLLGTGGMGGVYHAHDEMLGRFVAIKVMLKSLGEDGDFVETFKREAQAVAKLNHPHIAQIYTFGQEKGQPYIVMELITGRHLDEMIEEENSLDEGLVLRVALEISEGLSAADEIGLIHGDIKPENILLDSKGSSKLVDFGLATFTHQTAQEGIWGTPYYIAPEKVRRQRTDARSDIYSLGATLFHALTGRPPFEGETPVDVVKARLTDPAPTVSSLRAGIDSDIDRIVARMLEVEPGRRYPTYASLISDLKKTLERFGPTERQAQAVRGKKVLIRKRGSKSASSSTHNVPGAPKSGKFVVSRSSRSVSTTSIPSAQGDRRKRRRKAKGKSKPHSKAPLVILIILLLLALAGGGVYFGMIALKEKAEQALLLVEQAALDALRQSGATLCDGAESELGNLIKIEAGAMAFYRAAAANVLAVEAIQLATPQPPSEPEPEPVGTGAIATGSTNTNTVVEAVVPATPEPVPAPATTNLSDSLIMGVGRHVVDACETIMGIHAEARRTVAKAQAIQKALQDNTNAIEVTARIADIEALHIQMPGFTRQAREALTRAKESSEKIAEIRVQEEDAHRREREAAAETARKQAEIEAAARAAFAAQAEIDTELERAKADEAGVREKVIIHRYSDAARTLKRRVGEYKTEQGRTAIEAAVERHVRMDAMLQFFIRCLQEAPFRWGYVQGVNRLDILSANRVGIKLKGRTVHWRDVTPRQMFAFIKRYINDNVLSEGIKLRELANQNLNAAIFCAVNGSPGAARKYADDAIRLLPTMKADVDRLVPFPPEEEAPEE